MSFFQVTAAQLRSKAEELKGLNNRFRSSVESLGVTEQSLKSMWEGEANETFHRNFVKDQGRLNSFHSTIESFIEALYIIAAKYEEAEKKNIRTAGSQSC